MDGDSAKNQTFGKIQTEGHEIGHKRTAALDLDLASGSCGCLSRLSLLGFVWKVKREPRFLDRGRKEGHMGRDKNSQ